MPANAFNGFTEYGIGIGLRVPHYRHILAKKPVVDWFEIISENFMVDGGRPLEVLDKILEQYRVVQHGVSMYFGSADGPDREHLKKLNTLVKRTKTPSCPITFFGEVSMDAIPMTFYRCHTRGPGHEKRPAIFVAFEISSKYRFESKMSAVTPSFTSPI